MSITTHQLQSAIKVHKGLERLSDTSRSVVVARGSIRSFGIGQTMSLQGVIPSNVFFIISGEARLLFQEKGSWITAERLVAGETIGLCSLIRASPCEEVSAAVETEVIAIPDKVVLDLFNKDHGFRDWAQTNLFPAEGFALSVILQQNSLYSCGDLALKEVNALYDPIVTSTYPIEANSLDIPTQGQAREVFIASANIPKYPIGTKVDPSVALPSAIPPLPLRLISVRISASPSSQNSKQDQVRTEPIETSRYHGSEVSDFQIDSTSLDLGYSHDRRYPSLSKASTLGEEVRSCLRFIAEYYGVPFRREAVEGIIQSIETRGDQPNIQTCGRILAFLGLHPSGVTLPLAVAGRLKTPSLIKWNDGIAILQKSDSLGIALSSPRQGLITIISKEIPNEFPDGFELILVERSLSSPTLHFGLEWFLPAISQYRGILTQLLIASLIIQLFSLAGPLLIQVVIDKVINQRSLDTLMVIGASLIIVTILEGALSTLRTFLFAETSNRLDMRLGIEVIDHLLRLPLSYYDRRPVGELGTRVAELEKIRSFLTGQALYTFLDAILSVVYVLIMFCYSWILALVALSVLPIQITLTLFGTPLFKRLSREASAENAKTQSHLIEVLTGIQTVKSQNLELFSRWQWQDLYSSYIDKTFDKTVIATLLTQLGSVLQKLSQLLVLWVGAILVLDGDLTLGQLIAFRIIAGYVTQPLLRISSIWQSYQELKISFERLADVIDTPKESETAGNVHISLPNIIGSVEFVSVKFRFLPTLPVVLNNISFTIASGSFVALVGQSGSGKSTITKMISRLYSPTGGSVRIDGYDIAKVDLSSLRSQVGMVPQDSYLFSGTVKENLLVVNRDATSEEIVEMCQRACAHDFIMSLPDGYNTQVGERGSNLSGGQRQRIAIARAFLAKPSLLIFDEATSALDYNTERRIVANIRDYYSNHTVFYVTHRIDSVRSADIIIVMHDGSIAEMGTHEELCSKKGRYYAMLMNARLPNS